MQIIHETWHRQRVMHQVAKLKQEGFNVLTLQEGFCSEFKGIQVFRATELGNDRFDVAYVTAIGSQV